MTNTLAAAQAFLVAAVFVIAAASKLRPGSAQIAAAETPLARSVPADILASAWSALAVLELALASAVLLPVSSRIGLAASAALLAIFTGYQVWIARVAPGAPCGCFGAKAGEAASRWTVIRAGSLAIVAAAGAAIGGTSGAGMSAVIGAVGLAGAEGLALASFSPSSRERALTLIRTRRFVRDCATTRVPLEVTLAALRRSDSWQRWLPHLSAAWEVRDHWRLGCWRFVSFDAQYQGRAAFAVFAARVLEKDPAVRVALVDVESDLVLASEGSAESVNAPARSAALAS